MSIESLSTSCHKIVHSSHFQNFIIGTILLAGILVGIETYENSEEQLRVFHAIDKLILWIFVVEIMIKMAAHGTKPWRYFFDPWNIFDFSIVFVCFLPFDAQFVSVLRLARLLRVLRLITAIPELQSLVITLLRSIPSIGYVSVLLGLLFYIFSVMGVFFFSHNDPIHFKNLHISFLSLFQVVTLEEWSSIMYIQMHGCDKFGYEGMEEMCTDPESFPILAPIFFVSFVMIGTMIILNLFIGIIMTSMNEVHEEQKAERTRKNLKKQYQKTKDMEDKVILLKKRLDNVLEKTKKSS